jgi:hypothetical protein
MSTHATGGEFTKTLRKVSTCKKLKFSFLLLEYCKIGECYAVANAFTIRNMYSLFLYMKCNSRKITVFSWIDVHSSQALYHVHFLFVLDSLNQVTFLSVRHYHKKYRKKKAIAIYTSICWNGPKLCVRCR